MQDRDYASVARDSDRLRMATLPALTIRERRDIRRSFGGSPSYCFATRNVRAWSSDPQGMLVETNPHRNGVTATIAWSLAATAASSTVRHS